MICQSQNNMRFREFFDISLYAFGFLLAGSLASCEKATVTTPHIPIETLKQGDLAFRRGEGFASEAVRHSDGDGLYSHIGIVVKQNDTLKIAHSVPDERTGKEDIDRIKIDPIDSFFAPTRAIKGEIVRMPLTTAQQELIGAQALNKVAQKVEFDHDYDLHDTTKLYCTEFVVLLFRNANIDLAENRTTHVEFPIMTGDYIMPADIYKNKQLRSIFKY